MESLRSLSRSKSPWKELDDDEDLIWASLERLPTYDRVRKGVIGTIGQGDLKEVDIKRLGLPERRAMFERLLRVTEEDHESFLLKLRDRIAKVGIDFPTIEMRFEHVNVGGEAYVGSRSLPSFFNSILNILEEMANYFHVIGSKKRPIAILQNISGIIKPNRMTLLLGPPSSGKTTFLLALAGKLSSDLKLLFRPDVPLVRSQAVCGKNTESMLRCERRRVVLGLRCKRLASDGRNRGWN